jgi:Putative peptidoglycan binding domain
MPESSKGEILQLEQTVRELRDTVDKLDCGLPQSEKNGHQKSNVTPLLLTILGAIGTGILAISNSYFQGKQARDLSYFQGQQAHDLEQDKLRSSLILKAIDSPDAEERKKALTFYVEAGLLSDPQGKIAAIKAENIPQASQQQTPLDTANFRLAQRYLKRLGYYRGEETGIMDGVLWDAVLQFQKDNNLEVDGYPGGQTIRKMLENYESGH